MNCKKCKIKIIELSFSDNDINLCIGCFFQFELPNKIERINELMGFDERRQKVIRENLKWIIDILDIDSRIRLDNILNSPTYSKNPITINIKSIWKEKNIV